MRVTVERGCDFPEIRFLAESCSKKVAKTLDHMVPGTSCELESQTTLCGDDRCSPRFPDRLDTIISPIVRRIEDQRS